MCHERLHRLTLQRVINERNEALERIAELEAALRPAEDLPTWRELVERVFLGIRSNGTGLFCSGMARRNTLWSVVKIRHP